MKVFLSYAHADASVAQRVAEHLVAEGHVALIDGVEVAPGGDFVAFIEAGLSRADCCLLLWSAHAAERPWVDAEWHAALARSVEQRYRFLIVARLDHHPLPQLLAVRLAVDLGGEFELGMQRLLASFARDETAARTSGFPVGPLAPELLAGSPDSPELYVSTELWQITSPVRTALDVPAGTLIDRIRAQLALPDEASHLGRVGVRFEYRLLLHGMPLTRHERLSSQGVQPGSILQLETRMASFAPAQPVGGALGEIVFRGDGPVPSGVRRDALKWLAELRQGPRADR